MTEKFGAHLKGKFLADEYERWVEKNGLNPQYFPDDPYFHYLSNLKHGLYPISFAFVSFKGAKVEFYMDRALLACALIGAWIWLLDRNSRNLYLVPSHVLEFDEETSPTNQHNVYVITFRAKFWMEHPFDKWPLQEQDTLFSGTTFDTTHEVTLMQRIKEHMLREDNNIYHTNVRVVPSSLTLPHNFISAGCVKSVRITTTNSMWPGRLGLVVADKKYKESGTLANKVAKIVEGHVPIQRTCYANDWEIPDFVESDLKRQLFECWTLLIEDASQKKLRHLKASRSPVFWGYKGYVQSWLQTVWNYWLDNCLALSKIKIARFCLEKDPKVKQRGTVCVGQLQGCVYFNSSHVASIAHTEKDNLGRWWVWLDLRKWPAKSKVRPPAFARVRWEVQGTEIVDNFKDTKYTIWIED